jgi:hypothetical protein
MNPLPEWSSAQRRIKFGLLVAMSLMATTTPAAALPLWQPSGGWSVQMQGDHCVAGQAYTWNSRQLQFALEANPTGPDFGAYVITQGSIDGYGWIYADVAIGKRWMKHIVLEEIPSSDPGHIVYKWGFSEGDLGDLATAQQLVIVSDPFRLEMPVTGVDAAKAALRECDSKLLARWGFTVERQAGVGRFPLMSPLAIKKIDYPAKAEMRDAVGNVDGYVTVAADGKASDCHIVDSSGWPDIDARTCELMVARAVFTPGLDRGGRPIQAPYYFQFQWTGSAR